MAHFGEGSWLVYWRSWRFNRALWGTREMRFEAKPGIYWPLLDAEPGKVNRIGPPSWWLDPKSRYRAFRLSGGLFRPATM